MAGLTKQQVGLIKTVREDLEGLAEVCTDKCTDRALRHTASPILRRLLDDDAKLNAAWKALGWKTKPTVRATVLDSLLDGDPVEKIASAQAGGALYNGMTMFGTVKRHFIKPKVPGARVPDVQHREFTINQFMQSISIILGGTVITRGEIVRYVANKLGGIHFDQKRQPSVKADAVLMKLDSYKEAVEIAEKDAIFYELLAIGQAVVNSAAVAEFLSKTQGLA